ncbi:MFS transporter [Ktedonosporobacter rubrisoli]|uniref:MFS transporter n=2 Tax=Ktedonosporobacter rubrisoli TaxID=2509675 RepID=A0A4P6K506_KTERU|nr:MFS transporter [Ktedonosporobacter rubrisoli]
MLTMALSAMDSSIVATVVPSIVRDLSGFSLFPWVFSIYMLTSTVANPIYGKLADLYGRKPLLIIGTIIFLVGSMLCGLSWSMVSLIVFRGIQGIGAGSIQTLSSTVVGDIYTIEERGRIQGWLSSVWGISAIIGPALGGLFAQYASWRWIFYINIPIGILALLMISLRLNEKVERRRQRIDVLGALLLVLGTGLLIFGLLEGGVSWDWISVPSLVVFVIALLMLVAFGWWENRVENPIVPLWVFSRRILSGANLAAGIAGVLTLGLTTFLPTFAQGVLGFSPTLSGLVLATMSIGWPLASSFSARLYLRIGFRDTALIGMAFCLISGIYFVFLPEKASALIVALGSFIMGIGLGLSTTATLVGVQSVVEWNRRGVVTASNMFTRSLGSTLGTAVFGSISNSVLAAWILHAPGQIKSQIPPTINDVTDILGPASHFSAQVIAYVRDGLNFATHNIFWGMVVAAILGLLLLLITPRHFKKLHFAEDDVQTQADVSI